MYGPFLDMVNMYSHACTAVPLMLEAPEIIHIDPWSASELGGGMQTFARAGMGTRPDHAPAYAGHGTRAFLEE